MLDKSNCWIETFTGKKFHVLNPQAEEVCIEDIAHALSQIPRFSGHTKRFYSVAEHSVFVSFLCTQFPMTGLMHDSPEAYIGDMSSPVKYYSHLGTLHKEVENHIWSVIADEFGVPFEIPGEVHSADKTMLCTEREQLMSGVPWCGVYEDELPKFVPLFCYSPLEAEKHFLERFKYLTQGEN